MAGCLGSGQRKDMVDQKEQHEHGDHQQSDPYSLSLETLADRD
jgi:hypothetical protein